MVVDGKFSMKQLFSIRMRASKTIQSQKSKSKVQNLKPKTWNSKPAEIHVSGAEGLYKKSEIQGVLQEYIERALNHPRGKADKIIITIEVMKQKPKRIAALPVLTIDNMEPKSGEKCATQLLQSSGISKPAIQRAFHLIKRNSMRGAALLTAEKGERLEPDRKRGIRVSRLGISNLALKDLSSKLSKYKINTETVREAIILASKVSSCKQVIAELCVSDDPDYTTGYVASKKCGYVRIPHIKNEGSRYGGRVFFVREGIDVEDAAGYLEKIPVMVGKIPCCQGIIPFDEVFSHPHL